MARPQRKGTPVRQRHMRHNSLLAALAILFVISGCATEPKWTQYQMCFGLTTDAGQTRISDQEWERFRDEQIVTRFPHGFTLYNAQGYWQVDTKTYSEPSMVLIVVSSDRENTVRKLDDIAEAYKQKFHQECVLQIQSRVTVDFNE